LSTALKNILNAIKSIYRGFQQTLMAVSTCEPDENLHEDTRA